MWCRGFGSCGHLGSPGRPARHPLLAMVGRGSTLPKLQPPVQPGCRWSLPLMLCLKLQALLGLRSASLARGPIKHPGLGRWRLLGKWPCGEPGGGWELCLPLSLVPLQESRTSALTPRHPLRPSVPLALPCTPGVCFSSNLPAWLLQLPRASRSRTVM